jgi:hypothetical protein
MTEALRLLQKILIGNFCQRFSIGNTYELYFDPFWLLAHDLICPDEQNLNVLIVDHYPPADEAIDRADIAKAIVLSSTQRAVVTDVILQEDSAFSLTFENRVILHFPTNTATVDWAGQSVDHARTLMKSAEWDASTEERSP